MLKNAFFPPKNVCVQGNIIFSFPVGNNETFWFRFDFKYDLRSCFDLVGFNCNDTVKLG